jgi:uncharacterized oligopeptide transporter (OPT) family protein
LDFSLLTPVFILFLIGIGIEIGLEIEVEVEIGIDIGIGILRPLDSAKSFLESESESQSE